MKGEKIVRLDEFRTRNRRAPIDVERARMERALEAMLEYMDTRIMPFDRNG